MLFRRTAAAERIFNQDDISVVYVHIRLSAEPADSDFLSIISARMHYSYLHGKSDCHGFDAATPFVALYLHLSDKKPSALPESQPQSGPQYGIVRFGYARLLRRMGWYQRIKAAGKAFAHTGRILGDVADRLTDLNMPGFNATELQNSRNVRSQAAMQKRQPKLEAPGGSATKSSLAPFRRSHLQG